MKQVVPMLLLMAAGAACAHGALRDPFARPSAPAAAPAAGDAAVAESPAQAKPHLRAILFARGHALADIDGQVLGEGDWLGAWRVARIDERRVVLKRDREDLVLPLDREQAR